ncbi:MAG TPA: response regulator [Methylomirabilota bacterium]|nr:response regulator [Methylomirabilota bacterium]
MSILIADDEAPIVQLCLKVLQAAGHSVAGVTKGEDALGRLVDESVELLVVDYKMPSLDGFEVIRRARLLRPTLKIVLMTGHATQTVMAEAQQRKLDGLVIKPFTPDELHKAVETALAAKKSG